MPLMGSGEHIEMEKNVAGSPIPEVSDYYEFFQISPHATQDTIRRVYRYLAARYHPDNRETGDLEIFHMVRTVYEVLSDAQRRAEYDKARSQAATPSAVPLSSFVDFMDEADGEANRRLVLLAMLYSQRRSDPHRPEVSLMRLETSMGFPREYLDFTTWYLVQKGYITRADNSDFAITVAGIDYVEAQRVNQAILSRLLPNGKVRLAKPAIERRVNKLDRRMGLPDTRVVKVERRQGGGDRRANRI